MKCPKCGYDNAENVSHCNLCYEVLKKESQVFETIEPTNVASTKNQKYPDFVFRISTFSIHISIAIVQALLIFNVPFEKLKYLTASKDNIITLIAYSFGHVDIDHYFKNLYSYLIFGTVAALKLTPLEYVFLYVSTAVSGALIYALQHSSNYVLIGSSGVTRGFMGFAVTLLFLHSYRFRYAKYLKVLIYSLAAILLTKDIIGYLFTAEPIAYSVHFYSMVCGIIFCLVYEIRASLKDNEIETAKSDKLWLKVPFLILFSLIMFSGFVEAIRNSAYHLVLMREDYSKLEYLCSKPVDYYENIPPNIEYQFYEVGGRTINEVKKNIYDIKDGKGIMPEGFNERMAGFCNPDFHYLVDFESQNGMVHITNIRLSCNNTIQIPKWDETNAKSASDIKEWRRFINVVKLHQQRHAIINNALLEELKQMLESTTASSEVEIKRKLEVVWQEFWDMVADKYKRYEDKKGNDVVDVKIYREKFLGI